MYQSLKRFTHDENGAVTVDWVVLTAAIVALAVSGFTATRSGIVTGSTNVSTTVSQMTASPDE